MIVLIHLLFLDSSSPLKAPRFPCLKFFPHFLQLPWIVATCSVHDAAVIRVQANKLPRMLHRVRHGCCRHWTHIGQRNWHRPRCCGTTWKTEIELVHGTRLQTSTVQYISHGNSDKYSTSWVHQPWLSLIYITMTLMLVPRQMLASRMLPNWHKRA